MSRAQTFAATDPVPLGAVRQPKSAPVDVFPRWLGDHVTALADFAQVDAAMTTGAALGVLAACGGGRAQVEARRGWTEPTNAYVGVVAAPGERKSAVHRAMTEPLVTIEQALAEGARPGIVEAAVTREVAQRAADAARTSAARKDGQDRDAALAEAIDAAAMAGAIVVPAEPRLFADDVTPEATATLLAEQGGRLAILSAEGGVFDMLAGRYTSGLANLDVFLKGHAGDTLRVDRKGRAPEYVERPALTLLLMLQPQVLQAIARHDGFRGRGLLDRFWWVLPTSRVGSRNVDPPTIPDPVVDGYAAGITTLAGSLAGWTDPAVLTLTTDATSALVGFLRHLEPRLAPGADLGHVAAWGSKLGGAVVRIAGLLALADDPEGAGRKPVESTHVDRAVLLANWLVGNALVAFDRMGGDVELDDARYIVAVLRRLGAETVSKRDVFNAARGRFRKVPDLDPVLDLLTDHGWIEPKPEPPRDGPGRPPSPTFRVHPQVLADSAQRAQRR
ncbi:MAG: YfjI family protein [Candidatus Nanopelagicales bacterium]